MGMLSRLLQAFAGDVPGLTVVRYITFRAAMAAVTAFLIGVVIGPRAIRFLQAKKIGERGEKGDSRRLDELHRRKRDTPTMGGVIILAAALGSTLLWGAVLSSFFVQLVLVVTVLLAAIGFVDDRAKLTSGGRGLGARPKLALEVLIGLGAGIALYAHYETADFTAEASFAPEEVEARTAGVGARAATGEGVRAAGDGARAGDAAGATAPRPREVARGTSLYVPFFKRVAIGLGLGSILLAALVLVASANAVNLTDGLDGLAAGSSVFVLGVYLAVAYAVGRTDFAAYLHVPFVPGAGEAAVVAAAFLGACLAFLWFNCHPAEVFMGDTGSLPLGGAIGLLALVTKHELLLLIAGGVFVAEAGSVLLQVASFKLTGRRVFRCAPVHHHFEFRGLFETKVTARAWILGAILATLALATLKLR